MNESPSALKKENDNNSEETDYDIKALHKVPHNNKNLNPIKGSHKKAINCITQRYFVLCKKASYPESRYKFHISEQ